LAFFRFGQYLFPPERGQKKGPSFWITLTPPNSPPGGGLKSFGGFSPIRILRRVRSSLCPYFTSQIRERGPKEAILIGVAPPPKNLG